MTGAATRRGPSIAERPDREALKVEERPGEWRSALLVGLAASCALALLGALVRHEPTPRGDDLIYERIAQHPFGVHTFPFGYRIGLPWLVHVSPLSHTASFVALAWLGAGAAAAFAYLLMRHFGASQWLAGALALLMAVSPPFLIVVIRQGRNPDIATVLFMTAATYFVVTRHMKLLALTLLLGVAVRESELFVIALAYALWAQRWWDGRALREALLVGAPAIAAYLALHLGIHTVGRYPGAPVGARFDVIQTGLRHGFTEARRIFSVYGPLWVVAPLALMSMRFARRGLVLVAGCLVSMTFALDWGRVILLSAPVFYPASAYVLSRRREWVLPVLAAFAVLCLGYAVYMDHSGVRTGIIDTPAPPYAVR